MTQYIDKAALVAEIQKLYDKDYHYLPSDIYGYKDEFLAIIDELEVKEVDLEKEIKSFTEGLFHKVFDEDKSQDDFDWDDIATVIEHTAKHFFELGLKTTKEE